MSQSLHDQFIDIESLNAQIESLVIEDDTPVDNITSEKQQRLLTEPLYSNWSGPGNGRKFLVAADVGVFNIIKQDPIVPDVFISLDVEAKPDWSKKETKTYFVWEFGKPPDLALEIVSNKVGGENTTKMGRYAWMKVEWYIIYDPILQIMDEKLTIYHLVESQYVKYPSLIIQNVGLGLTLWDGIFEASKLSWLRWTDLDGKIIPTGKERAEEEETEKLLAIKEKEEAIKEKEEALKEKEEALKEKDLAQQRANLLAAKLKDLGINPETL